MAPSSRPDPLSDRIQDFVAWIDHALEKDLPPMEVASVLTEYALPSHRGLGLSIRLWRRGMELVLESRRVRLHSKRAVPRRGDYLLGCLLVSPAYPERLPSDPQECRSATSRTHPSQRADEAARVPAALGLIEDITTFTIPTSTENLSNLSASGYSGSLIQTFIDYVSETYRSKNRFPLYPEVVLHTMRWGTAADTTRSVASLEQIVGNMQQIASRFAPETLESSVTALRRVWQQYSLDNPVGISSRRACSWPSRTRLRSWIRSNLGDGTHPRIKRRVMTPRQRR